MFKLIALFVIVGVTSASLPMDSEFTVSGVYVTGKEIGTRKKLFSNAQAIIDQSIESITVPADVLETMQNALGFSENEDGAYDIDCLSLHQQPDIIFKVDGIDFPYYGYLNQSYIHCLSNIEASDDGKWHLGTEFIAENKRRLKL